MVLGVSPLVLALLAGAAAAGGVAVYAWRRKTTPARVPFVGLTATDAVWVGTYAVALSNPPGVSRAALEGLYLIVGLFVGIWWVLFGLAYAGRRRAVSARTGAALSAPAVATAVLFAVDPSLSMLWTLDLTGVEGVSTVQRTETTALYAGLIAYLYLAIAVGYLLVLRQVSARGSLYTEQTAWMVGGSIPATVAGVVDGLAWSPVPGLQTVPFTVPLVMVGFAVALTRHEMTDITPGTGRAGREVAFRDLSDPVVVTDGDGRVADCNVAAEETFGVAAADAVGHDLTTVVHLVGDDDGDATTVEPDGGTEASADPPPTEGDAQLADGATVTLLTTDGRRRFEVSVSTVGDDPTVGRALVFREVTRRRLREQRLAVLNRVVRHNLRNDMNAVVGYAELAAAETDSPHLTEIRDVAEGLVSLGEKAHALERSVAADRTAEPVAVRSTVDHVLDRLDADSAAVTVDVPEGLAVTTDDAVFEVVLHNVVENAVEHAGSSPTVEVVASETGDGVEVTVTDDGPGVPETERRALASGTETPLEHGSGLGLWVVAWGTQWLGGEVSIACEDGTTVTIRVPDVEADTRPDPAVDAVRVDVEESADPPLTDVGSLAGGSTDDGEADTEWPVTADGGRDAEDGGSAGPDSVRPPESDPD